MQQLTRLDLVGFLTPDLTSFSYTLQNPLPIWLAGVRTAFLTGLQKKIQF
jgi:hypothetical protein